MNYVDLIPILEIRRQLHPEVRSQPYPSYSSQPDHLAQITSTASHQSMSYTNC
ncbi:hypothetical protein HYC85_027740 [Camellia sinensis]|uniref:Uncharacterized protein n=1 Tax=Camellia sinensis TaxID=4442 RepID=A0A7J7FTE8_CAMSI|nr:hypothetical protein HYC85_027740 [Camellia sinensis]